MIALLIVVVVPVGMGPTPGARAHGGALLAAADAGPYRVQVMASRVEGAARPTIDITAYVVDREGGRPVEDADVVIVARVDGRDVRAPVQRIGNGYEALVPVPDAGNVRAHPVTVEVRGTHGTGLVRIEPPEEPGAPLPAILGSVGGLLALGLLLRHRRRAAAGPAGHGAQGETAAS
ncbi:MAG: hypothetical protein AB7G37_00665 [Solirubrobacteraceae bacterium]